MQNLSPNTNSARLCRHLLPIYILRRQNPRSNTRDTRMRKGSLNGNQLVGSPCFFCPSPFVDYSSGCFQLVWRVTDGGDEISIIRLTRLFCDPTRPADSRRRLLCHSISYAAAVAASLINIGFGSGRSGHR